MVSHVAIKALDLRLSPHFEQIYENRPLPTFDLCVLQVVQRVKTGFLLGVDLRVCPSIVISARTYA